MSVSGFLMLVKHHESKQLGEERVFSTDIKNPETNKQKTKQNKTKPPETDIGAQVEDQKSKTTKPLEKSYLYQSGATAD